MILIQLLAQSVGGKRGSWLGQCKFVTSEQHQQAVSVKTSLTLVLMYMIMVIIENIDNPKGILKCPQESDHSWYVF